ncbi:MAG: undecaprenyldiphospho-muramoylpentapeptide beta-N-acetylglucosaminyltransferase [Inconstantimicrobium porci]|uniref:undecaprenyldiphospho-muramoylpentapeptide beta-N-acetylglucosaminyltransferase n=1 Tax=Inconstantimicrobium porci TaxID=2652291 RepID=UPI0024090B20|nr:undecaprenyldiphospho-muramoylpentapeptide beta-N-acetylglucosaminyltransferase [Inconstantimicrobium porci]MDD6770433.1 undecaprenyldiphospho-muramoylpentapeptide beta-N-acetylglucosaminyltransferase [Inconstantimicrobium porci]MDY5913194.1 undecaprenyldiphospho-muramoylpentapeptide beta-N-acetylglucosaminyltransferase [Inconstantimicrobium porci]
MSKYKIIMTGGGSAGHVTPNIAIMPLLKSKGFEIKYIGSKNGIEKEIIGKTDIPYYSISSGKLRRYFDLKNFSDPFKVIKGVFDSMRILRKEKPDIIFSKGGFVSVPVVMAAHFKGIPVVSHESDMTPGLANKLAAPFCSKLCVTFPESLKYIKDNKGIITGTPIRKELYDGNAERGRKFCGFTDNRPVLLVVGGSLGSKFLNDTIRAVVNDVIKHMNVVHICGKGNIDKSLNGLKGYKQFEYVSAEMADIFKMADYIISRAGANSIFEILALKKPNILIPLSRNASRGDQILNSKSFEKAGYSIVIEEEELTKEKLMSAIDNLKNNKSSYIEAMEKSEYGNGSEKIVNVIIESMKCKKDVK